MKKLIITMLIISALGALTGCSNTDSSMSVTTPSSTSVTTTTTSASATSQSEGTTTTTSALESQVPSETQMTTEVSHTEGESSSNTESVSSSTSSEISVSTTSEKSKTEGTKPAITTTTSVSVTKPKVTTTTDKTTTPSTTKPKVTTTTKKATTTTKKQTTTSKATTTRVTEITQPKVTTTTTASDSRIGTYGYIRSQTYIYSKPDLSSESVCELAAFTKVYITSKENGLYKIVTNEKKLVGYIKGYLIMDELYGGVNVNKIEDIALYDDECFKLMNEHRKSLGLPELKYSSELQKAADIRAKELTVSFSHFRPNGEYFDSIFEELGIEYDSFRGEINCSGASLPNEAIEAWIDSPAHYQHMISTSYNAAACSHNGYQWIIVFIKE